MSSGICSADGICKVMACQSDYHIYNNACEPDSVNNCGGHDIKCNVENADNNCINRECTYTCKSNYHTYLGGCESDSIEHCGSHDNKCPTTSVANGSRSCKSGKCSITCKSGYHVYDEVCEANSVDNCGAHGRSCKDKEDFLGTCIETSGGYAHCKYLPVEWIEK